MNSQSGSGEDMKLPSGIYDPQKFAQENYLFTSQVAKLLNLHRNTIINAIRKGKLKAERTQGGHARISMEEFERFRNLYYNKKHMTKGEPQKRILIVDDDQDFNALLQRRLQKEGFMVNTVDGGYAAGIKTGFFKPHLMVLDIMMPDIDGVKVLKVVREMKELEHMRVLAVSGVTNSNLIDRMFAHGVNGFEEKTSDLDRMVRRIKQLLNEVATQAWMPS